MKYKVGDLFLIYHGNSYTRGILVEIEVSVTDQPDGYHIAWFDGMAYENGSFRIAGYNFYELRNLARTASWQHYPVVR